MCVIPYCQQVGLKEASTIFVSVYCHVPSVWHTVWHIAVFSDTCLMNEQHHDIHSGDCSVSKCPSRDGSETVVTWVRGLSMIPRAISDGFLKESLSCEMI